MEEIRRSPVEVGSWNPIIYVGVFMTIPGGFLAGFLNHQQYVREQGEGPVLLGKWNYHS